MSLEEPSEPAPSPARVGLFTDPGQATHHAPGPHPERPERVEAVLAALETSGLGAALDRRGARAAEVEELCLAHAPEHVERVRAAARAGRRQLDPDTFLSTGSYDVARRAAGAAIDAARAVLAGELRSAFVATRPPGHHAEHARAMGFCLFDQVAVAARWLRVHGGVERVAIVDFDVHHGNGTQDVFWDDPSVLYASLHESPLYPGTGAAHERGGDDAQGTNLNRPQAPGADGTVWLRALEDEILPAVEAFRPQFLLLSAGFDAHARDPLARTALHERDFARMTELLASLAPGRLVSVLEGGYDLQALGASAVAHVGALVAAARPA